MNRIPKVRHRVLTYNLFMLFLCLFALGIVGVEAARLVSPQGAFVLEYADFFVCALFFLDFWVCLYRAPDRWRYLRTWGWLDLVSSIPSLGLLQLSRAARVVRIFRLIRGVRATRILADSLLKYRAQNAFLAACLVALLLVVVASISVLHFETSPQSNIHSAQDALWWAFATITTVGYGDKFPVTGGGRFVACILMCAGVGMFGVFSGFLAAWFLSPASARGNQDLAALREEVAALRAVLESAGRKPSPPGGTAPEPFETA